MSYAFEFAPDFDNNGQFNPTLSSIADLRYAQRHCLSGEVLAATPPTSFLHVTGRPEQCAATQIGHVTVWSSSNAGESDTVSYLGGATNNDYLFKHVGSADRPTRLFVAKLESQGTGSWIEVKGVAVDLDCIEQAMSSLKQMATQLGATKVDRPQWCATNIKSGDVYFLLDKHNDSESPSSQNNGGHIIRLSHSLSSFNRLQFSWDIFLFGSKSDARLAGEIWYSQVSPGLLWIHGAQPVAGGTKRQMTSLDSLTCTAVTSHSL